MTARISRFWTESDTMAQHRMPALGRGRHQATCCAGLPVLIARFQLTGAMLSSRLPRQPPEANALGPPTMQSPPPRRPTHVSSRCNSKS